jgi:hypothetical protein
MEGNMATQEQYFEKATGAWAQQMERWMDSVNLCQNHVQKFMNVWVTQAVEAQKENQKFLEKWTESVNKNQTDMWKAWQASAKEATSLFGFEGAKTAKPT